MTEKLIDRKTYKAVAHEFLGMGAALHKAKEANTQAFKALRAAFGN